MKHPDAPPAHSTDMPLSEASLPHDSIDYPDTHVEDKVFTDDPHPIADAPSETRTSLTEKAQQVLSCNARRIGIVAVASGVFAIAPPVTEGVVDKAPTAITRAAAAEVDYGTGGYPWAHLTPGTGEVDGNGRPIRDCTSWVAWRLSQNGVDISRMDNWDVTGAVIIDTNPAIGAAANTPDGRHALYVEDLTDTHITVSDYNGIGGPYKYGIKTYERTHQDVQGLIYAHFELPDPRSNEEKARWNNNNSTENETPKNDPDVYANLKKLSRNVITANKPIREGSFIHSKNDRYRLSVQEGVLNLRDTKANDRIKWSIKTDKEANLLQVKLDENKRRNQNTLVFGNRKKAYRTWNIGSATKVEIGNNGKLIGYRGKQKIWQANSIHKMNKAAKKALKNNQTNRLTENQSH